MTKYADEYVKKNYKTVIIRLKHDEFKRYDKLLKKYKLSRREYLLKKIERDELHENNLQ